MTPHKCPVCDGTGRVPRPPFYTGGYDFGTGIGQFFCNACQGSGIVWKKDAEDQRMRNWVVDYWK
jgi:hypothetical protein